MTASASPVSGGRCDRLVDIVTRGLGPFAIVDDGIRGADALTGTVGTDETALSATTTESTTPFRPKSHDISSSEVRQHDSAASVIILSTTVAEARGRKSRGVSICSASWTGGRSSTVEEIIFQQGAPTAGYDFEKLDDHC